MSRAMDRRGISRAIVGGFPVGMGLESVPRGDAMARALRIAASMRRLRWPGLHMAALGEARAFRQSGQERAIVAIGTRYVVQ